jgi:hypothetical protein
MQHAGRAAVERGRVPAASTPIILTLGSSRKGWKSPIALEPPPTQATSVSGSRPSACRSCLRTSSPMMFWKSRTIAG